MSRCVVLNCGKKKKEDACPLSVWEMYFPDSDI